MPHQIAVHSGLVTTLLVERVRKTLRTTNVIERLNGEFRRRVKTQASLPTEDSALVLLFSLVASGQVKLRRIDGWEDLVHVLSQHSGTNESAA